MLLTKEEWEKQNNVAKKELKNLGIELVTFGTYDDYLLHLVEKESSTELITASKYAYQN